MYTTQCIGRQEAHGPQGRSAVQPDNSAPFVFNTAEVWTGFNSSSAPELAGEGAALAHPAAMCSAVFLQAASLCTNAAAKPPSTHCSSPSRAPELAGEGAALALPAVLGRHRKVLAQRGLQGTVQGVSFST